MRNFVTRFLFLRLDIWTTITIIMLKNERSSQNLENDKNAIASMHILRNGLKTPASFVTQTRAALFQRIELDTAKSKRASWYLLPHGFKRLAALTTAGVILASAFFSTSLFSPSLTMAYVGEFDAVHGDVFIHRGEGTVRAKFRDKIFEGDTIEVASSSNAHITFGGEAKTELAANTRLLVQNIITTTVASNVSSEVHLALQSGTFTQKRSDKTNDLLDTGISVTTSSGVIKATAYADFVVRSDDPNTIALSVRSEGVSVIKNINSSDVEESFSEGQSVTLVRDQEGTVVTTDTGLIVTATGSLIRALEMPRVASIVKLQPQKEVVQTPSVTVSQTDPVNTTTSTAITMPSKPALDLRVSQVFEAIRPRLEIAEVKLNQALSYHVNGQEDKALIAMEGYVSTVGDIYKNITPQKNTQESSLYRSQQQELSKTLDVAVGKSTLSKAYDGLISMQQDLDKDSEVYMNSLASLELLSKAEAALRIDIAQQKDQKENVHTDKARTTESLQKSTTSSTDAVSTAPEKRINASSYTRMVQGDIYTQARSIVNIADGKERSSEFLKLLGRIPNEERNIVMLERIQSIVPDNLRGFVAVKIHAIKYPEAK